jgi:uncharacterized membrane protein YedE/YeeE
MTKINVVALFSGILFSIGLGISGMTKPQKVIGFLDILGEWDMSLIFVMVGGIITYLIFNLFIKIKLETPILVKDFYTPSKSKIDRNLIFGSILFGAGWGLGGYCPGPAITSIGTGSLGTLLFVFSMGLGMFIEDRFIAPIISLYKIQHT